MVCGRRFGKTTASAMEATYYASQPNRKIWLVGLSYDKADLMFREVWQKMVIGRPNDIIRASEKDRVIKFKWGTTVEAKSADNPDSLVGEGLVKRLHLLWKPHIMLRSPIKKYGWLAYPMIKQT